MSKMDNLRAMREAKYARGQERATSAQPSTAKRPARPAAKPAGATTAKASTKADAEPAAAAPSAGDAAEELCGHRNMSGRTCTREHGHAAKSHRYS